MSCLFSVQTWFTQPKVGTVSEALAMVYVTSLFCFLTRGCFAKLNWNQQVIVWPALVRTDLLGINFVYLDCFFWLAHKYLWQIGFKPIVRGLLWHNRIIYVSEFHPLKSRFYFTNKNASVHFCWTETFYYCTVPRLLELLKLERKMEVCVHRDSPRQLQTGLLVTRFSQEQLLRETFVEEKSS